MISYLYEIIRVYGAVGGLVNVHRRMFVMELFSKSRDPCTLESVVLAFASSTFPSASIVSVRLTVPDTFAELAIGG